MPRFVSLLTTALLLANPTPPQASVESAAALLLDNEELCLRVGEKAPTGVEAATHPVAARALAKETLEIAEELLERVPRASDLVRLLGVVVELQRRICGGPDCDGNCRALGIDLESAARRLEATLPTGKARRQELLLPFLDRRDMAISGSLEAAQVQHRSRKSGAEPATKGTPHNPAATGPDSSRVTIGSREQASEGPEVGAQQIWDPSPEELARRRQQKVTAFYGRLAAWRPTYRRELRELAALRSTLARELEQRSLQHVRGLCGQLTGAVSRVEYEVVLTAPEPSVREFLDRMLAGYAAAGRWCSSGRFAFAWIEIEKADRRWRQLSARLSMLDSS